MKTASVQTELIIFTYLNQLLFISLDSPHAKYTHAKTQQSPFSLDSTVQLLSCQRKANIRQFTVICWNYIVGKAVE